MYEGTGIQILTDHPLIAKCQTVIDAKDALMPRKRNKYGSRAGFRASYDDYDDDYSDGSKYSKMFKL